MDRLGLILLLFGLISSCLRFVSAEQTCEDLGFTGLALCSDCDALAEIVKDEELESDCRRCCAQEDEESSKATYAGAVLEVCMRKLVFYQSVQTFIDTDLERFPGLQIQYRFGSTPKLIMQDSDGNVKETIRIDNWKTEHIEQFLKQKLRGDSKVMKV